LTGRNQSACRPLQSRRRHHPPPLSNSSVPSQASPSQLEKRASRTESTLERDAEIPRTLGMHQQGANLVDLFLWSAGRRPRDQPELATNLIGYKSGYSL